MSSLNVTKQSYFYHSCYSEYQCRWIGNDVYCSEGQRVLVPPLSRRTKADVADYFPIQFWHLYSSQQVNTNQSSWSCWISRLSGQGVHLLGWSPNHDAFVQRIVLKLFTTCKNSKTDSFKTKPVETLSWSHVNFKCA